MMRERKLRLFGAAVAMLLAAALGAWLLVRNQRQTASVHEAACDRSSCPKVECAPGSRTKLGADGCCLECVAAAREPMNPESCAHIRCAPCAPGTREQVVAGQCCPSCVGVDDQACKKGKAAYEARWSELELQLRGCQADDDCSYASIGDACRASCPLALNKHQLAPVVSRLRDEAARYCEACAPPAFACPHHDVTGVACLNGRCELREGGAQRTAHSQ